MKPYPLELRERIVSSVDQKTHTIAELAEIFQITERYIYKLLKLRRETGDLTPLPHSGGVEPILNEQRLLIVADLVAHYPDATLKEYRALIHTHCGVQVCLTTVWAAMEKSAFTRKKKPAARRQQTRQNAQLLAKNRKPSRRPESGSSTSLASI
jgi:transposase